MSTINMDDSNDSSLFHFEMPRFLTIVEKLADEEGVPNLVQEEIDYIRVAMSFLKTRVNLADEHNQLLEEQALNLSDLKIATPSEGTSDDELVEDTAETTAELSNSTLSNAMRAHNVPKVEFDSFITNEKNYLLIEKKEFKFRQEVDEMLQYPLGVVYDEIVKTWFIAENKLNKIMLVSDADGVDVIEMPEVYDGPSALCINKEGESIAILCSTPAHTSIVTYNYELGRILPFLSSNDAKLKLSHVCRGLAKSIGGSMLTLDSHGKGRLRILRSGMEHTEVIPNARNPSFIASCRKKVAITDLGTQSVYMFVVNDLDWDEQTPPRVELISRIGMAGMVANQCMNAPVFCYVAGCQFDANENVLIGDARGRTIKLFESDLSYIQRLSCDFCLPYMSNFFINSKGEASMVITCIKGDEKMCFAQLTCCDSLRVWIAPTDVRHPPPRRGTFVARYRGRYRH
ncbi:unnamed protein product [Caenorhabditis bovis]|uniref:Uncharacterized protein n=1 Tax=Caenorhabditis bovis TaxID=2654633 RepID=A0A8S1EZ02_9PELO|nr:unnamed protein product [Caenorhabditis bovis]